MYCFSLKEFRYTDFKRDELVRLYGWMKRDAVEQILVPHFSGRNRPALPALCLAEALDIGATIRFSISEICYKARKRITLGDIKKSELGREEEWRRDRLQK